MIYTVGFLCWQTQNGAVYAEIAGAKAEENEEKAKSIITNAVLDALKKSEFYVTYYDLLSVMFDIASKDLGQKFSIQGLTLNKLWYTHIDEEGFSTTYGIER